MPPADTPAALAALDKLERLALEARSAQERSFRQPITTNQVACDEACQALERACSPDVPRTLDERRRNR